METHNDLALLGRYDLIQIIHKLENRIKEISARLELLEAAQGLGWGEWTLNRQLDTQSESQE